MVIYHTQICLIHQQIQQKNKQIHKSTNPKKTKRDSKKKITWPVNNHKMPLPATQPPPPNFSLLVKGIPTFILWWRWRHPGESWSLSKLDSLLLRLPKLPGCAAGDDRFESRGRTSPWYGKKRAFFRLVYGELTVSTYRSSPSLPNTLWVGVWIPKHPLRRPLGGPNISSQGIWISWKTRVRWNNPTKTGCQKPHFSAFKAICNY